MGATGALQNTKRHHRLFIAKVLRIAALHDPCVIHRNEIQHGCQKILIGCPTAQITFAGAGCAKEDRQKRVLTSEPGKTFQCNGFGGIFVHCQGFRALLAAWKRNINLYKQKMTVPSPEHNL